MLARLTNRDIYGTSEKIAWKLKYFFSVLVHLAQLWTALSHRVLIAFLLAEWYQLCTTMADLKKKIRVKFLRKISRKFSFNGPQDIWAVAWSSPEPRGQAIEQCSKSNSSSSNIQPMESEAKGLLTRINSLLKPGPLFVLDILLLFGRLVVLCC